MIGGFADGAVVASALLNAVDAAPAADCVAAGVAYLRSLQAGAHHAFPSGTGPSHASL